MKEVSEKERRSRAKKTFKEAKVEMGVFAIRNKINGRVFLCSSTNLRGVFNKDKFQLNYGSHRNKKLQSDWSQYGADSFDFEIIESVEKTEDNKKIYEDLDTLMGLCREKLAENGVTEYY